MANRIEKPNDALFITKTCRTIERYSDMDGMRFVHHGKLIDLFEVARLEALKKIMSISYGQLEKKYNISQCIRHEHLNYKNALTLEDKCYIDTYYDVSNDDKQFYRKIMTFYQELWILPEPKIGTVCHMEIGFFNNITQKSVSLPEEILVNIHKNLEIMKSF